jgi:hypothetical protein
MEKTRTAEVNIVHVDGSRAPALHAVDVPKAGSIGDLYVALAQVPLVLCCCFVSDIRCECHVLSGVWW